MPSEILTEFVDWILASPDREWFTFGCLVGGFVTFSVLTGYWIISDAVRAFFMRG